MSKRGSYIGGSTILCTKVVPCSKKNKFTLTRSSKIAEPAFVSEKTKEEIERRKRKEERKRILEAYIVSTFEQSMLDLDGISIQLRYEIEDNGGLDRWAKRQWSYSKIRTRILKRLKALEARS